MYNKVFKNYQVNLGVPFQVRSPINYQTVKKLEIVDEQLENEELESEHKEDPAEIISKAREEAELLIKEAQLEALRFVENAEKEIEEIKQAAEDEARKRGYEEGFSEAKRQYEDLIQEAEFIREHAKVEYKEVLAGIEADAVNVILEIAKKVIGAETSFNKEDILYLVKQAFEKCSNKERVVLKAAPEDYEYLVENKDRLLSMVEGLGELNIKKDSSLKTGACIIETPYGSVDASIQTKMKRIEEAFRQVIGK